MAKLQPNVDGLDKKNWKHPECNSYVRVTCPVCGAMNHDPNEHAFWSICPQCYEDLKHGGYIF